jgi:hypothetical protein
MLRAGCRRVPADYLPGDPGEVLHAFTPATVSERVDAALATLDLARSGNAARLVELEESVRLFADIGNTAAELALALARLRVALANLMVIAARRRDDQDMLLAFCGWLGLRMPIALRFDPMAWAALGSPKGSEGLLAPGDVPAGPRIVVGDRFTIAVDGAVGEDGVIQARAAWPVAAPGRAPFERLGQAIFVTQIAARIRGARQLRVTPFALEADTSGSMEVIWTAARRGAIRVEPSAAPLAL